MGLKRIYQKVLELKDLTLDEAKILYKQTSISELMFVAHELRKIHKQDSKKVGWIIDRNVNITNVCIAHCKFCNFCRTKKSPDAYITTLDEYKQKIEEMIKLGGNQLLLQGGMHPDLGLDFYTDLFKSLKSLYPNIKLHALSPTEVVDLADKAKLSYKETLQELIKAGLDSLPGAGAEILSERVRKIVSPAKCSAKQWFEVMEEAHKLLLPTSATMMFGSIETSDERLEHLIKIRDSQAKKPINSLGYVTFVPWPYQPEGTKLQREYPEITQASPIEYLRLLAISRIILNNIKNIQASWLTVGKEVAQLALYGGANDLGSIMIEENVVSAAGAKYTMDDVEMKKTISDAGFEQHVRNQKYEFIV